MTSTMNLLNLISFTLVNSQYNEHPASISHNTDDISRIDVNSGADGEELESGDAVLEGQHFFQSGNYKVVHPGLNHLAAKAARLVDSINGTYHGNHGYHNNMGSSRMHGGGYDNYGGMGSHGMGSHGMGSHGMESNYGLGNSSMGSLGRVGSYGHAHAYNPHRTMGNWGDNYGSNGMMDDLSYRWPYSLGNTHVNEMALSPFAARYVPSFPRGVADFSSHAAAGSHNMMKNQNHNNFGNQNSGYNHANNYSKEESWGHSKSSGNSHQRGHNKNNYGGSGKSMYQTRGSKHKRSRGDFMGGFEVDDQEE